MAVKLRVQKVAWLNSQNKICKINLIQFRKEKNRESSKQNEPKRSNQANQQEKEGAQPLPCSSFLPLTP